MEQLFHRGTPQRRGCNDSDRERLRPRSFLAIRKEYGLIVIEKVPVLTPGGGAVPRIVSSIRHSCRAWLDHCLRRARVDPANCHAAMLRESAL